MDAYQAEKRQQRIDAGEMLDGCKPGARCALDPIKTCIQCGEKFRCRTNVRICSDQCRDQREAEWSTQFNARRRAEHVPKIRESVRKQCQDCGQDFLTTHASAIYCGDKCAHKAGKRRRKHRLRTNGKHERYTMAEIADRDGWKCHLCGRKVNTANWSVDHLIPISKGGDDTRINVRIAHHHCNSLRGTAGAVQLVLI